MIFIHSPPKELLELSTETINNKRYYITPNGKYPSITTVLGQFKKDSLLQWRKRVGEEEANKISNRASSRGTKVHLLCEKYLLNEKIDKKKYMPDSLASFYSIKPHLHRINNIHKLEVPLYSNRLQIAGRCDAIAEFDDVLSIIDYKTSSKEKKEEWIEDYFQQATFYALCYAELTGIVIKQIVIIIAVDDGNPQVFVKQTKDYIRPLIDKIKYYYKNYH